uniref:Sigma3 n=1 Tax=xi river reovirus TaxID=748771 RepID=D5J9N4_9REOV|nr:sigma3 [xi river reovirus]
MTEPLSPLQRREVVTLILTMSQSISASRSTVSQLMTEVSKLSMAQNQMGDQLALMNSRITSLHSDVTDLSTSTSKLREDLNACAKSIATVQSDVTDLSNSITSLSSDLSDTQHAVTSLQSVISEMSPELVNLKSSVSANAVSISGLTSRLDNLSNRIPTTVVAPLTVSDGALSLTMNGKFCSNDAGLNAYSSMTQMQSFNSNVQTSISGTNLSTSILVHSRGGLTAFNLTTNQSFTANSADTKLKLDCTKFSPTPTDWSVLIPKPAFQSSDFLCVAWMCVNSVWIPASVIGKVDSNPKVMYLPIETKPSQQITGLVISFSIDT